MYVYIMYLQLIHTVCTLIHVSLPPVDLLLVIVVLISEANSLSLLALYMNN